MPYGRYQVVFGATPSAKLGEHSRYRQLFRADATGFVQKVFLMEMNGEQQDLQPNGNRHAPLYVLTRTEKMISVERCRLFAGLSHEQIGMVADLAKPLIQNNQQALVQQGAPSPGLFLVTHGVVEIRRRTYDVPEAAQPGQPGTWRVRYASSNDNEYFGEIEHAQSAFGDIPLAVTNAVPLGPSTEFTRCLILPHNKLWELMRRESEVMERMFYSLGARYEERLAELADMRVLTPQQRIIKMLVEEYDRVVAQRLQAGLPANPGDIILSITSAEIIERTNPGAALDQCFQTLTKHDPPYIVRERYKRATHRNLVVPVGGSQRNLWLTRIVNPEGLRRLIPLM